MNSKRTLTLLMLLICTSAKAQYKIAGSITNKEGAALHGANISIVGTMQGGTAGVEGKFSFETVATEIIFLEISCIGYEPVTRKGKPEELTHLSIILYETETSLDDVIIQLSSFNIGKSRTVKKMSALDIVMTGSSNGDIFRALQSLPGTQIVGEDGELYIRGGSARESQTFIDGMHVLAPYTNTAQNMPARGRFSPFLFSGINFSLGGYESEFGQALSSILPMDTKDVSTKNKIGINASPLGFGSGGTQAWRKSSLSASIDYTDLGFYNTIIPDNYDWKKNYKKLAAESQFKKEFQLGGVFKVYGAYEKTSFIRSFEDAINKIPRRNFDLNQRNYYLNSTLKRSTKNNFNLFFGSAFSYVDNEYTNASYQGDQYKESLSEVHLKAKASKTIFRKFKMSGGVESYLNSYGNRYIDTIGVLRQDDRIRSTVSAAYLDNQVQLLKSFYATVSGRLEYADFNKRINFAPRLSLNYLVNNLQLSAIYGQYYQIPENSSLLGATQHLHQEKATHFILGTSYNLKGILIKAEAYRKKYENLIVLNQASYTSDGFGKSQGIDLYLSDETSVKNFKYNLSYSYNDSERLFLDYPEQAVPQFVTKHNARLSLRYYVPLSKSFIGISNSYASGRPYTDPNLTGFMNGITKAYHSLDMNITFLLNRNMTLFTSMTNVLNRKNIYGYQFSKNFNDTGLYSSAPVEAARNRFFYIGLFVSFTKTSAYDPSYF